MTRRELKALVDSLASGARQTFFEEHGHPTRLYFRIAGKPFTIAATVTSEDDKTDVRSLFEVLARGGAEACGMITEGWSAPGIERALQWHRSGRSMRELPGRREVLIVEVVGASGHERREFLIDRSGRHLRLRRLAAAGGVSQFLTGLPWLEAGRGRRIALPARVGVLHASAGDDAGKARLRADDGSRDSSPVSVSAPGQRPGPESQF